MQQFDKDKLLRKYLTGQLSDQEHQMLQKWVSQSEINEKVFQAIEKIFRERSEDLELVNTEDLIDRIWEEGMNHSRDNLKPSKDWNYIFKVAAVILIFLSVIFIQYRILKNSFKDSSSSITSPVTKENPEGQKTKTYLPDGSIVWLNGGSKISYSPLFNDSVRFVELEGEAFFEVAENKQLPFVVRSGDLETTALGTSFNINAYPDNEAVRVSLVSGKVEIENIGKQHIRTVLNPGYELLYMKDLNEFMEQSFDPKEVMGWKNGILIFKSADYKEFTYRLEKWYGIDIITNGNPPEDFILTTSYDNENLKNIMMNIQFSQGFDFEIQNDKLIIRFK
jgi:ferric-dicitrate binding protein FerR (iron transport regulator)